MTEPRFEDAFLKAVRKQAAIKKAIRKKVDMIVADPVGMGEPLKGNWRGFYSSPVKRNFIIIYLYCDVCRKRRDEATVACTDCNETENATITFILLAPHDEAYGR